MASLLLWVLTHQADCKAWVQQGRAKGYFILGLWKYPEPRKKKIFSSCLLSPKSILSHTCPLKYLLFFFSSSLRRLMTRRRLTRKRSALNPEPNMINTFCGRRGEGHWNQELLVVPEGHQSLFYLRKKRPHDFSKQTGTGLLFLNLVICKRLDL